nr:hypothetical protein OG999_04320 [Streptomyces sp. NBC_00886]
MAPSAVELGSVDAVASAEPSVLGREDLDERLRGQSVVVQRRAGYACDGRVGRPHRAARSGIGLNP